MIRIAAALWISIATVSSCFANVPRTNITNNEALSPASYCNNVEQIAELMSELRNDGYTQDEIAYASYELLPMQWHSWVPSLVTIVFRDYVERQQSPGQQAISHCYAEIKRLHQHHGVKIQ